MVIVFRRLEVCATDKAEKRCRTATSVADCPLLRPVRRLPHSAAMMATAGVTESRE